MHDIGEVSDGMGDGEALGLAWRLRERVVRFFLRNHTNYNLADAEDLTQQTYLNLARSYVSREVSVDVMEAYLFCIARNVASDWHKAEARRRQQSVVEGSDPSPQDLPDLVTPYDEAVGRQSAQRAQETLDRFPDRARLAFWLRTQQGASIEEIAITLGVSRATVSRDLRAVLLALKRAMDDDGGGSSHD